MAKEKAPVWSTLLRWKHKPALCKSCQQRATIGRRPWDGCLRCKKAQARRDEQLRAAGLLEE